MFWTFYCYYVFMFWAFYWPCLQVNTTHSTGSTTPSCSLQGMSNDLIFALFYKSTLLFCISIFKKFICFLMFAWQISIFLYSPPSTFAFHCKPSDKISANSIEEFPLKICLH
jgi:hypothetical protein